MLFLHLFLQYIYIYTLFNKLLAMAIIYIMITGMSMVLSNWIITPIKVGCKSPK